MQHAPPVLLHAAHKETSNSPGHHFEAPSGIASSRVCLWPTAAQTLFGIAKNLSQLPLRPPACTEIRKQSSWVVVYGEEMNVGV